MVAQSFTQGTAYGSTIALTTNTTVIGNIIAIPSAPELMRSLIETTHSGSTGGWKEFIPGDIKDAGSITVTCQYSTQLDYKTLFAAGCDTITITFPKRATSCGGSVASVAASFACSVVFEKFSAKYEFDSQMAIDLTFKLTGPPTYTAATA